MGKTMGRTNDRCPLQAECEKKCAYVGRELDCHYYDNNARPGYEIDDQEELRRARSREAAEAGLAAMSGYKPERPDRTIETVTVEILDLKREAGEAILEIGARLIEAKGMLSHGEWLPWLTEQVEFSERTAQRFMRLAQEWSNPTTLSDLGASKALALLALPPEERDQFIAQSHAVDGQEKEVIDMSARELEKAIRERKEALAAAEEAAVKAKTAEEARAKMEADMKMLKGLLESAKAATASAEDEAGRLARELEELKAKPVDVAVMQVDQEALDKAREEAVAGMQDKLDKAVAVQKKAEEKRKAAEEALAAANAKLEQAAREEKKAVISNDKDMAAFEVLFQQGQENANKMSGILIKLRGRDDQTAASAVQRAMLALSDAIGRAAQ